MTRIYEQRIGLPGPLSEGTRANRICRWEWLLDGRGDCVASRPVAWGVGFLAVIEAER